MLASLWVFMHYVVWALLTKVTAGETWVTYQFELVCSTVVIVHVTLPPTAGPQFVLKVASERRNNKTEEIVFLPQVWWPDMFPL